MPTDIIDKANTVLQYMRIASVAPHDIILERVFEKDAPRYVQLGTKLAMKRSLEAPWGTFLGGVGEVREAFSALLPSEISTIMMVLKDEGRIYQCGRGGGRAFIVVDPAPLADSANTTAPSPVVLAKALKSNIESLVNDMDVLKERNKSLEQQLEEKDKVIAELRSTANVSSQLTWH